VTLKTELSTSSLRVVDVDVSIITASDDLIRIELEARDDMTLMCSKGKVVRLHVVLHPALADQVMPSVE